MRELPEGWVSVAIGEINDYDSGNIDPQSKPQECFELYSVPIFPTRKPEMALGVDIGSTKQKVAPNDVLLCKINPRINRVWQVAAKGELKQIASSEWIIIRQPLMDSNFLRYQLSEQGFRERLCAEVSGVGGSLTRAQPKKVTTYKIVLPPLAEQTRIAQKLDELLAQVDTLKARIDGIPALLKRFRQSILAAAVSGRLTEEWRLNASAWSDTTIGQVCSVATGKTPKRDIPGYWENGDIPWLTSALTGSNFCSEAEQFVTAFAVKDCALKVFQPGTLLMAMYGEGKTRGQVTELKIAATCNQACAALVVDESLARKAFVKIRLQENYEEIRKQAVGGAQPNLNLNKVREITIRLPSLPEQTEIVRRVEQLFAFADQLEAKVASAKSRIDHLTQSILAKAFRGELVPQDPNDEPASVLLERINAQRAAAPKAKRGRKASV